MPRIAFGRADRSHWLARPTPRFAALIGGATGGKGVATIRLARRPRIYKSSHSAALDPTYQAWMSGDALVIGRAIMQSLPAAQQVARGIAVLEVCRAHWAPIEPIDRIVALGGDPRRCA